MNFKFNQLQKTKPFQSAEYWEKRYRENGNSGLGSYNKLAIFKAEIINDFITKNNIKSIVDYGMGDGNQLKLFKIENINYIGIDVSSTIIEKCKNLYKFDKFKQFILEREIDNISSELVLSCDVIYHLIEDDVYYKYIDNLFKISKKFVIIYAPDIDMIHKQHVKLRKFTDYVKNNYSNWKLINFIKNKYPQKIIGVNDKETSFSDFFIYENT